ncbi:acid phosphatase [Pseudacidovorax intermedius]|uniref:Acid phosphatase n=1 Tax=Pseudacidovorax intermedius TaxID=433924 RepID=A0A147GSB1_9BURK|nr:acid phosphatase [Pseudacidovorax intermedius]KTT20355.1 acid phosphatase [Pseudacidovorax intermedius]
MLSLSAAKHGYRLLPVAALAIVLAACGGSGGRVAFLPASSNGNSNSSGTGGGSSSSGSNGTASISGIVAGSYYRNAKVCLDSNNNGRCDSGEPSTRTDANGAFTLNGAANGALVAEIGTDAVRFDPATGTATPVAAPLVFRAPADANGVLSAVSTEVVALMDRGQGYAAASAMLAGRLGVSTDQLRADPNKIADTSARGALQLEGDQMTQRIADAVQAAGSGDRVAALSSRLAVDLDLANKIQNVVVIYAENRGFDNLYGLFPGANGVPGVNPSSTGAEPQKDRDGSVLSALPPTWGGLTAGGQAVSVTQAQTIGWANKPFQIDAATLQNTGVAVSQSVITRDLVHRFFNDQMQINGGKNDLFAAYSDAGGLTMGYYDGSAMAMWKLAQQNVLADNFFMGAFGGSFLTHQYLVCACAPEYPNADTAAAKPSISAIDTDASGNFVRLTPADNMPASALNGPPAYKSDGNITPKDANGKFYAVNTMQPPFQPSGNAPASGDTTGQYADPSKATTLPAQTATTIADLLDAKGVSWAWYSGAWASASQNRSNIYNGKTPNFQAHHQPFNYFAKFDPVNAAAYRNAHLKDFDSQFLADAAAGKLPAVAFYKPQGNLNQHPGYADVASGDAHIADVIAQLKKSPQWKNMVVVVTYDENGGFYDHAAVPKGDRWGPGTRIPAIVISDWARHGVVDKTQYDTASVLRLVTRRFGLPRLDGLKQRDQALTANGFRPMGDLTAALDFSQQQPGQ